MLRTAARLGGRGAGPGRPALCDLRRSTSTSYYALFHQITRHGALIAVPSADEAEISEFARWFSHTGVREAARLTLVAAGPNTPRKPDRSAVNLLTTTTGRPIPDELRRVARVVVDLQDARHDADYSNDYDPVRYVTLGHVDRAEQAVKLTWSMWRSRVSTRASRLGLHDSYRRFLQLALLSSGGPKTR